MCQRVDLGVDTENLLMFAISPELNGYTPERSRALFERVEDELAALPGVTSVTASLVPLLGGSNWGTSVSVQGFEAGPDTDTHSNYNEVGAGLLPDAGHAAAGRPRFHARRRMGRPRSRSSTRRLPKSSISGRDAVGKRMGHSSGNDVKLDVQIVGLVQDAKYSEVKNETPPFFFLPYRQDQRSASSTSMCGRR